MRILLYVLTILLFMSSQAKSDTGLISDAQLRANSFINLSTTDLQKLAKTHWLPDFQAKDQSRVNDGGSREPTCSLSYKYTAANCSGKMAPSGSSCGGKFDKCTCKDEYQYNNVNCSSDKKPMGDTCDGKFNQCEYKTCEESGYLASPISGETCTGMPYAGKTCYNCREMTCSEKCENYSSNINSCPAGQTKETCSGCSNFARCTGTACPQAKTNCDYGCANMSTQQGCSDVCVECKTCTKNNNCTEENYPYLAAEKPMNGVFEECSVGCGDSTTRYKMAQCLVGYADPNTYWCSIPKNTSCATLGYVADSACAGKKILLRCIFDSSMVYCSDDI